MQRIAFLHILLISFGIFFPQYADSACSDQIGKATLNEVYEHQNSNFIEIKLLDTSVDYSGWSIQICSATDTCSSYDLSVATLSDSYLIISDVENINLNQGEEMDAVLYDEAGATIDYLLVNGGTGIPEYSSCPDEFAEKLPDGFNHEITTNSDRKGIFRDPDGVGEWVQLPDSGSGGEPTEGGDNAASTVGSFNAFDPPPDYENSEAIIEDITTKISGEIIDIYVVAVKNQEVETNYNRNREVYVELVDASTTSCLNSTETLAGPITTTLTDGRAVVAFSDGNLVADAFRNVQVRMIDEQGTTACSTDNFAIRPHRLVISASDADWQSAGTDRSLANLNTTGGNVHKAGRFFTLQATAVNALDNTTTNYAGQPDEAFLSDCGESAACPTHGTLNTGTWSSPSPSDGTVLTNSATYDEVGAFDLLLEDRTFAEVDADDTLASDRYIQSSPQSNSQPSPLTVGRFVPDHFIISDATLVNRSASVGCLDAFSYMGETFSITFTLEARTALPDNPLTQNYTGSLARLDPTNPDQMNFGATDSSQNLTSRLDTETLFTREFKDGWATLQSDLVFSKNVAGPDGPFENLDIGIAPQDADGVTLLDFDLSLDSDPDTDPTHQQIGRTETRFGRVSFQNAFGPELFDLAMALQVESFHAGGYFQPNADDSCTDLSLEITDVSPNDTLDATTDTCIWDTDNLSDLGCADDPAPDGKNYNEPPVGGDFNLFLKAPGTGKTGSADLKAIAPPWLQFDWDGIDQNSDGNDYDDNPTARATFGIYKGNPRVIYMREVY